MYLNALLSYVEGRSITFCLCWLYGSVNGSRGGGFALFRFGLVIGTQNVRMTLLLARLLETLLSKDSSVYGGLVLYVISKEGYWLVLIWCL